MNQKRRESNARRTGLTLEAMYQFLLWLAPTVEKFARSQKLLLGECIQSTALDVPERLIEATCIRRAAAQTGDKLLRRFDAIM